MKWNLLASSFKEKGRRTEYEKLPGSVVPEAAVGVDAAEDGAEGAAAAESGAKAEGTAIKS